MFGMSALAHQVNMNNFLSLLVGASLVAANSSPSHHDLTSFSQPSQDFSNGVSSFALPAEDSRMAAFDSYTLAFLNYSYTNRPVRLRMRPSPYLPISSPSWTRESSPLV